MSRTSVSVADIPTPYWYGGIVKPEWLDDNGHMNVAYYMSAFDDGGEVFFNDPGIGWEYTRQNIGTIFVVSSKVDYHAELLAGDAFRVATRLLDFNSKLLHVYYEITKQPAQHLCATAELLYMHISFETRKSAPMSEAIVTRLTQIRQAHASLPIPKSVGSTIGIRG